MSVEINHDKDRSRFLEARKALRSSTSIKFRGDEDNGFNLSFQENGKWKFFNFVFDGEVSIPKEKRKAWENFLFSVIDKEEWKKWEKNEFGYIVIPYNGEEWFGWGAIPPEELEIVKIEKVEFLINFLNKELPKPKRIKSNSIIFLVQGKQLTFDFEIKKGFFPKIFILILRKDKNLAFIWDKETKKWIRFIKIN